VRHINHWSVEKRAPRQGVDPTAGPGPQRLRELLGAERSQSCRGDPAEGRDGRSPLHHDPPPLNAYQRDSVTLDAHCVTVLRYETIKPTAGITLIDTGFHIYNRAN